MGKLAAATIWVPPLVSWLEKKKKKGKKKLVNYIVNFLSRAFSQGPSFFTLFFIGALNGKSLPDLHL
jgi:hypothetical protein